MIKKDCKNLTRLYNGQLHCMVTIYNEDNIDCKECIHYWEDSDNKS